VDQQTIDLLGLYDNIRILAVQPDDDWADAVVGVLRHIYDGTPASSGWLRVPLASVLAGVRRLGCRTVVFEREYFDEDYLDVFRAFYCRGLTEYPRNCVRLHFFRCEIRRRDLLRLNNKQAQAYLGFVVIPPVPGFLTGRTIVRPWNDDGVSGFITCKIDMPVNLSGNELSARGAPFIQQDTNVNVCAGAALWSIGHYMWRKYGLSRYRPSRITDMATKYLTIGQQRRGLTPEQISQAMRDMGYSPLFFPNAWPRAPEHMARIIHAYVESELPVLAILRTTRGAHAVAVVGHDFQPPREGSKGYSYNSDWIGRFYVHDDAYGPYMGLQVSRSKDGYSIQGNVAGILVPAPRSVAMQADQVFEWVDVILRNTNKIIGFYTEDEDAFLDEALLRRLMRRTYLRLSNQFKVGIGNAARRSPTSAGGFSAGSAALYRSMRMPKHVWVTELSTPELLRHQKAADRQILGEILIDSTAGANSSLQEVLLAMHVSGRMLVRAGDAGFRVWIDKTERPYPHLVRAP